MSVQTQRDPIKAKDWIKANPLKDVDGIGRVIVDYVGQGDAVSITDLSGKVVARIDYGGRESRPFARPLKHRLRAIDARLPVGSRKPIFLTHWDEDHWCSALVGGQAAVRGRWITPRQFTSPRAALRSTRFTNVACLPAALEQVPICFKAVNGDELWCEKIGRYDPTAMTEDCNLTGMAFTVVRAATGDVVFLPGDAPIHKVPHYARFRTEGHRLRGLVAYHHGSHTHGIEQTEAFLRHWSQQQPGPRVVFSCGDPNSYDHPWPEHYKAALPHATVRRPRRVGASIRMAP